MFSFDNIFYKFCMNIVYIIKYELYNNIHDELYKNYIYKLSILNIIWTSYKPKCLNKYSSLHKI